MATISPETAAPLRLIAGPCVIENMEITLRVAEHLQEVTARLKIPFLFKSSYDKANRSAITAYRGPGLVDGLEMLHRVKVRTGVAILSDVHSVAEVAPAAEVLDMLQIPAFLCRQTDLLVAAARSGRPVNIKKGQFMAPWDMRNVIDKVRSSGSTEIWITERGSVFGYNNLVVDFRSIPILREMGCPVIFDATHSVQLPGGRGDRSGGQRRFAPTLARAAAAAGSDGIFIEVHPDPDNALCDGPNSLPLAEVEPLLCTLLKIRQAIEASVS